MSDFADRKLHREPRLHLQLRGDLEVLQTKMRALAKREHEHADPDQDPRLPELRGGLEMLKKKMKDLADRPLHRDPRLPELRGDLEMLQTKMRALAQGEHEHAEPDQEDLSALSNSDSRCL